MATTGGAVVLVHHMAKLAGDGTSGTALGLVIPAFAGARVLGASAVGLTLVAKGTPIDGADRRILLGANAAFIHSAFAFMGNAIAFAAGLTRTAVLAT